MHGRYEQDYSRENGRKRSRYETSRRTPGPAASPWDHISHSPVPICASGCSVRSSNFRHGRRPHQLTFSTKDSQSDENGEGDGSMTKEHNQEISESMRLEMDYNSDCAWYDREEGNTNVCCVYLIIFPWG